MTSENKTVSGSGYVITVGQNETRILVHHQLDQTTGAVQAFRALIENFLADRSSPVEFVLVPGRALAIVRKNLDSNSIERLKNLLSWLSSFGRSDRGGRDEKGPSGDLSYPTKGTTRRDPDPDPLVGRDGDEYRITGHTTGRNPYINDLDECTRCGTPLGRDRKCKHCGHQHAIDG